MEKTDLEIRLQWAEEELEKKKKELEALKYFTAAVSDIIMNKKLAANMAKLNDLQLLKSFPLQKMQALREACAYGAGLLLHAFEFDQKKKEFFKLDPANEDHEEIRKSLSQLDLKEDGYGALYMCAAGDKLNDVCNQIMGRKTFNPNDSSEQDLRQKRTKAIKVALEKYRKGDRKAVALMLKEGLKHSCKHFAHVRDENEAMEISNVTSEILYIYNHDPNLAKEVEISEDQIKIAKQVAELGNEIKVGMMAVNLLISDELDNKVSFSKEQREVLVDMAFRMKTAITKKQELAKKWENPAERLEDPQLETPKVKTLEPRVLELSKR